VPKYNPNIVEGPASAIDSSVPLYSGTTGKLLKAASGVSVTATGMSVGGTAAANKLDVAGNVMLANGALLGMVGEGTAVTTSNYFLTGATSYSILNAPGSGTIGLRTNNVDRVRITNAGNVGCGTTAPASGGGSPCLIMVDAVSNPSGIGTNCAGVFAKDVAGTTEFFAIDEAANATQLTAHASDGPDAAYADPVGGRGVEWMLRRESPWKRIDGKRVGRPGETLDGCITWENPRTGVTVSESFAEYVARMGYTTEDAERLGYVAQDWDEDQASKSEKVDKEIEERVTKLASVKKEMSRQRRLPWNLRSKVDIGIAKSKAPKRHQKASHPFGKVV
jgi:hypothetical protein